MDYKISVIGTGRMGSPLATALHNKGCSTTAWNRTPSKTEALARLGLRVVVADQIKMDPMPSANANRSSARSAPFFWNGRLPPPPLRLRWGHFC